MKVYQKIKILIVCVFTLLSTILHAYDTSGFRPPEPISSIKIYSAHEDQDIHEIAALPDQEFVDFNITKLELNKHYWLKIIIDNKLVDSESYILHFNSTISYINLYQQNGTSAWIGQKAGILVPEKNRALKGFIKDKVPFKISQQTQTTLYIWFNDTWGKEPDIADIIILPEIKFNRWLEKTNRCQFFFLGIITVLCLFNFILYLFTKEKIYFYYFAYAMLAGIYFSTYFQIFETGFFSTHANLYNFLFFSITLNQAVYCWFLFQALKDDGVEKEHRLIYKYAVTVSFLAIAIIIISIFSFRLAILSNYMFSMVNGLFTVFIFYILFRKVSITVRIILAGSIFVVIGGVGAIIINQFKVAIAHVYIYQTGFFIELIFFSVAINFMHYSERMEKLKVKLKNSLLESEKLKREKEAHLLREEINLKNRDIASKAIMISQKESLIKDVINQLKKESQKNQNIESGIQNIIHGLESTIYNNYWDEFETHFIKVHPDFYNNLNNKYPNLTANERKICAFMKLNLTTKEIANITQRTPESIHIARFRLRRKMRLDNNVNLEILISGIN